MKLPPLAIGGATGLAAALLLAPATGTALGELATAREEHARLAALAAASPEPPSLLASGLGLGVASPGAGQGAIVARVRTLARGGGVLVEETGPAPAPDGVAAVRIRVSGAEKAVIALVDAMERGRPLMRLRNWRIEPIQGGGVRLIGEAVAAWR